MISDLLSRYGQIRILDNRTAQLLTKTNSNLNFV